MKPFGSTQKWSRTILAPTTANEQFISDQLWWDVSADIYRKVMERMHPEKIEADLRERTGIESVGKLFRVEAWKAHSKK